METARRNQIKLCSGSIGQLDRNIEIRDDKSKMTFGAKRA